MAFDERAGAVLVTGTSGYLASWIILDLLRRGSRRCVTSFEQWDKSRCRDICLRSGNFISKCPRQRVDRVPDVG